jgi:hypothetical protein
MANLAYLWPCRQIFLSFFTRLCGEIEKTQVASYIAQFSIFTEGKATKQVGGWKSVPQWGSFDPLQVATLVACFSIGVTWNQWRRWEQLHDRISFVTIKGSMG